MRANTDHYRPEELRHIVRVGKRVRALRTEAAMRQEDLAKKLRTTQTKISQIEKGQVSMRTYDARTIARTFGASLDDLLK